MMLLATTRTLVGSREVDRLQANATHSDSTPVESIPGDLIPVIDITALRDGSDPDSVARQLLAASQDLGFIYVKGHGIPKQQIHEARALALQFFLHPPTEKIRYAITPNHRGWLARGGARMHADLEPDLKESFLWGYQDNRGQTPSDHPLRGPNQWPDFVPEMESVAMEFFHHADQVARILLRGFALGLNLEANFFLRCSDVPLSRGSFVYYPPQESGLKDQTFGVGPHTDFGVLTVLCQDHVGGLQVQHQNGRWIEAPPIEGTLVVNVGDLLERWTDGQFRSTPHRVINTSGEERMSLVLAFDPGPDTMIDPREIFGPDRHPLPEPIRCGDYLIWRFGQAFDYRAAKGN